MGLNTQQDPIGIAGGLNLYGYANGDPVNYSDPFGLCPAWKTGVPCFVEKGLAGAAVGGVAGAAVGATGGTFVVPGVGTVTGGGGGAVVGAAAGLVAGTLAGGIEDLGHAAASIGSRLRKLGEIITIGVSGLLGPQTPPAPDELLNPETRVESPARPSGRNKPKEDEDDEDPLGSRE